MDTIEIEEGEDNLKGGFETAGNNIDKVAVLGGADPREIAEYTAQQRARLAQKKPKPALQNMLRFEAF